MGHVTGGYPPRHPQVIRGLMEAEGLAFCDVLYRSGQHGRPISSSTLKRVFAGHVPTSLRVRGDLAAALSSPEEHRVINAAQLFGDQPLPRWAQDLVYGVVA